MTAYRYNVPMFTGRARHEIDCHIVDPTEVTEWLGGKVLELLQTSYRRQFEDGAEYPRHHYQVHGVKAPVLPRGTAAREFDATDDIRVQRQTKRMRQALEQGSIYAVVCMREMHTGIEQLMSLAKVTRRTRLIEEEPELTISGQYLYTNDLLARVPRKGLGSIAWYSALRHIDADEGGRLVLDGFAGSSVNGWFESLGFEPVPENDMLCRGMRLGGTTLPQTRYAARPFVGRKILLQTMARQRPWLAEGEMHESVL